MERVPEPELMDGAEQAAAYAAADFSASDGAVIARLGELFPGGLGSQVVDLGCGPGNISFRLAELRPAPAQVLAIDGASSMLALAARELERRRQAQPELPRRLLFRLSCLPDPALPGGFSAVVSNSLLHHLHDPQVLWQAVRALAAPGAVLFLQDLRRPADEAALDRLVRQHAASLDPLVRADYVHSLRAAFTPEEVLAQLQISGLEGLAVTPHDDRYLRVQGRLPGRLAP
jgi:SAM-dependent methyltransferase